MKVAKVNLHVTDANRETAMKYVAKKGYGYMKELKQFDEAVISEMKQVGFLKTGWTKEEETFGATNSLLDYVKIVFGFEPQSNLFEHLKTVFGFKSA